jgi:hypothetical protein
MTGIATSARALNVLAECAGRRGGSNKDARVFRGMIGANYKG